MVRQFFVPEETLLILRETLPFLREQAEALSLVGLMLLTVWLIALTVQRMTAWVADVLFSLLYWCLQLGQIGLGTEIAALQTTVAEDHTERQILSGRGEQARDRIAADWVDYFSNPNAWWDNRSNKRSSKSPDFRHKISKRALWIDSWHTPEWVRQRFSI